MKSTITINQDDNLSSLKVIKPCTRHHWFNDIDKAYDKFNALLNDDIDFNNKWYREPINSPFVKGAKSTNNQLRAFFVWYVDGYGGQAIPF
tara:strand:+ start:197 stop:469 length:273 start_codon:yes stop_codon:yes gene_type:complete